MEPKVRLSHLSAPTAYFDQAYRDYQAQNPPRKLDHYLDQIDSLSTPGSKDILDIGCGLGSFLKRTAVRHPKWRSSGSDIDSDAITTTRQVVPGASIVHASAVDVPFEDDSFDIVTAWDVLEHVPDLETVAVAVNRVLRSNGLFVFVVPVYDGITGPLIRLLDKDPTHVHKQSRDAWLEWAKERFEVLEWHGLVRYLIGKSYLHFPTSLFRRQTPAILVACRGGSKSTT